MNNETLTKCICHKGFSGYSSIVARSNFRVGGQETTPQSLTAHTLDRYAPFYIKIHIKNNIYGNKRKFNKMPRMRSKY